MSWLSAFPNEDEKLFYGLYVRFQISDIIEGKNLQKHSTELKIFNKFEELLNNSRVDWNQNNKKGQRVIEMVTELVRYQQTEQAYDETTSKSSKYGYDLFKYFCTHQDRAKIVIKDYKSIPNN